MKKEELDRILSDHAKYLSNSDKNLMADLRGVDLRGVDLRGVDLRYTDLRSVDLRYADLRYVDLRYTDLRYTYLRGAQLSGTQLGGADLRSVDLRGVDLRGAKNGDKELKKCKTVIGLHWNIMLFDEVVTVGCKEYTFKEWLNFSNEEIQEMDRNALDFYPVLKSILEYEYKEWKDE
jgi:uncharacterized protein YjbI with pentapeptide repeats